MPSVPSAQPESTLSSRERRLRRMANTLVLPLLATALYASLRTRTLFRGLN